MIAMSGNKGASFPHDPARRGYHVVYRSGEVNHCPGCGRSHWYVGRLLAECGFCATALPLVEALSTGAGLFVRRGRSPAVGEFAAAA